MKEIHLEAHKIGRHSYQHQLAYSFAKQEFRVDNLKERLHKQTSSYLVSYEKMKAVIGKPLPVSSRDGFLKKFRSFNN